MRSEVGQGAVLRRAGILVLALLPAAAWGLGLGPIQTNTRIGQAFSARIPILGASANDLQGLTVALASPDDYKAAGLSEPDYLFSLKFNVVNGPRGPYVEVSSAKAVRLPFLNLLVHADWSSGEVTRQYTVLLNPPVFAAGTRAAPVSAPAAATPATRPIARTPAPSPVTTTVPHPQVQSYGPVPHGATLWGLAHRLRPSSAVSVNQMMMALYRANPDAFVGNINRLKAGYVLRVPSQTAIEQMSATNATRSVAMQNRAWRSWRNSLAQSTVVAAQPPASAAPSASSAPVVAAAPSSKAAAASTIAASVKATTGVAAAAPAVGKGRVLLTAPKPASVGMAAMPGTSKSAVTAVAAAASTARTKAAGAVASVSTAGPVKLKSGMGALAGQRKASAGRARHPPGNAEEPAANGGALMNWLTSPKGWIVAGVIILLLILLVYLLRRRRGTADVISAADRLRGAEAAEPPAAAASAMAPVESAAITEEMESEAPRAAREEAAVTSDSEPVSSERSAAEAGSVQEEHPEEEDFDLALETPTGGEGDEPMDFERIVDELSTFIETYVPGSGEPEPERISPQGESPALREVGGARTETTPPAEDIIELSPEEEDAIMGSSSEAEESEAVESDKSEGSESEGEEDGPEALVTDDTEDPVNTKLDLARAYVDLGDPESARGLLEEVIDEGSEEQQEEARRLLDSLG